MPWIKDFIWLIQETEKGNWKLCVILTINEQQTWLQSLPQKLYVRTGLIKAHMDFQHPMRWCNLIRILTSLTCNNEFINQPIKQRSLVLLMEVMKGDSYSCSHCWDFSFQCKVATSDVKQRHAKADSTFSWICTVLLIKSTEQVS